MHFCMTILLTIMEPEACLLYRKIVYSTVFIFTDYLSMAGVSMVMIYMYDVYVDFKSC